MLAYSIICRKYGQWPETHPHGRRVWGLTTSKMTPGTPIGQSYRVAIDTYISWGLSGVLFRCPRCKLQVICAFSIIEPVPCSWNGRCFRNPNPRSGRALVGQCQKQNLPTSHPSFARNPQLAFRPFALDFLIPLTLHSYQHIPSFIAAAQARPVPRSYA